MKIHHIYKKYKIPQNLQEHMLTVSVFSLIIAENWIGRRIDKDSITKACLLHDLAKPLNFDLTKQAQFGISQAEIKNLGNWQIKLKTKYGKNEHEATLKICQKIGCSSKVIRLIDNLEWDNIPSLLKINDLESLIPIYCDMRIGSKGILPLKERLSELEKRTKKKNFEEHLQNGVNLEKKIKENVAIDLDLFQGDIFYEKSKKFLEISI